MKALKEYYQGTKIPPFKEKKCNSDHKAAWKTSKLRFFPLFSTASTFLKA